MQEVRFSESPELVMRADPSLNFAEMLTMITSHKSNSTSQEWWLAVHLAAIARSCNLKEANAALAALVSAGIHLPPVEPLLDGREIAAALNLEPGPSVGRVAKALSEAQLARPQLTREEALAWVAAGAPPFA